MKKIRRMLSTLVIASMLMNVPVTIFAESDGEAPAAVEQQAEAPKQETKTEPAKAEEPASDKPE